MPDSVWRKFTVGDRWRCWEWQGQIDRYGYGKLRRQVDGKLRYSTSHRFVYEQLIEPVPDGLVVDHLCRNRLCVNPWHLDPVTNAENIRRGETGGWQARKTHCKWGHEFTDENTRIIKGGYRVCRACARRRSEAWKAKQSGVT